MPPEKRIPYKFILFVILFLIADFVIDNINHRFLMGDFNVYYGAAHAITTGKQVYGVLFSPGSGYYKYSPFIALVFYPLSILPYYASCVIYFLIISAAIILTSILLFHIFSRYVFGQPVKSPDFILSLSVLCISIHLIREIGLGNVNMILLLLLSLSLLFIIQKKMVLSGMLLALVIITKPFLILILIPLVMRRYFKTILTTIFFLLLFMVLPAVILGIGKDIELHKQWLNAMLLHAEAFPSPNTMGALIRNNVSPSLPSYFQYIILLLLLIPYILFIRSNILLAGNAEKNKSRGFIMEWFSLIALMPSVFKTDTEHFLIALPLILYILMYLFSNKNTLLTLLFVILIILYAGNSSDLLGKPLSLEAYNLGILGISNLLLIALALFIYFKHFRKTIVE